MQEREIFKQEESNDNGQSIKDIAFLFLRNWYWFVISVIFCVAGVYLYGKSVSHTYQAKALIMIKADQQKGAMTSESAIFSDMGIVNGTSQVEGEMYTLRSTGLMKSVVERLGLDVSYSIKPRLRTINIYGANPVEVVFCDKELTGNFSFKIIPVSKSLYKYAIPDKDENLNWINAKMGDTISTSSGRFVVKTTPQFGIPYSKEIITVNLRKVENMTGRLRSNLTIVRPDKITNSLALTIQGDNLKLSKDVLNMLITVYNEDVIKDKNKAANSTEKFIVERIAAISEDLGGIDGQIEQLKKDNKITDFGSTSNILLQAGSKYKDEVVKINTEISIATFIKEYLSDPAKKSELIPANTGIGDIGIEAQIASYNEGRMRLDKLSANSGANNPVTIELSNSLNVLKANMIRSIDNLLSSLSIKRSQALGQEDIANRRIASVPTQEKQVNDVTRQQKIKEELYLYLLNKREENALKLAITEANAKIIEYASGSETPVSPNMSRYMLIAALAGMLFPISIIIIIQFIYSLDSKIHNKRDIEKATSIPIIGEIPHKNKKRRDEEIIISETGRDRISEAFRMIRSNMDYIYRKQSDSAVVIQATSTLPGEGKSYVTINMALSYAHTGKRVLVIDLDLRKGKTSKMLKTNGVRGMSDFLSGKIDDIDSIINRGVLSPAMDVISIGSIPPNPANLLMSERLDFLIEQLRGQYDYIFIDTVPYAIIADAKLINRVADVTLYIIRDNKIDKRYLKELEKLFQEKKVNNLTILVTDVDVDNTRYGYGYGYGYGYSSNSEYGYGYIDNEDSASKKLKKQS